MIKPQKVPFANTTIPANKSRQDIDKLLEDYGIEQVQWTQDKTQIILNLGVEAEIDGQTRNLALSFKPPMFLSLQKVYDDEEGRVVKKQYPNKAVSMRLLFHYLKMKLSFVAMGITRIEEEFLGEIIVRTPRGPQKILDYIHSQGLLALPPGETTPRELQEADDS